MKKEHQRISHVIRVLKSKGVTVCRTQFPCMLEKTGVKTRLDGLGYCCGSVAVIELKTTQHDEGHHRQNVYDKECSRQPVLSNGLMNTERTHHLLQTGFGMLCVKSLLPNTNVRGFVVISYPNSARIIEVGKEYCSLTWFTSADMPLARNITRSSTGKKKCKTRSNASKKILYLPWPHDDPRVVQLSFQKKLFVLKDGPSCMLTHAVAIRLCNGNHIAAACISNNVRKETKKNETRSKISFLKVQSTYLKTALCLLALPH